MNEVNISQSSAQCGAEALKKEVAARFGSGAFMLLMTPRQARLLPFAGVPESFFAEGGTLCVFDSRGEWMCEAEPGSPAWVTKTEEGQGDERCFCRETAYILRQVSGMDVKNGGAILWRDYFCADKDGMLKNVASRYAGIGGANG